MTDERRYPLKLEELKAALEQKAGKRGKPRTRRVRTAEGAKKYGVPIGTIIVLDANGKPFNSSVKPKIKPSEDRNVASGSTAAPSATGFKPTNYGDPKDAKGGKIQVGGEYTVGKTGGKWFVDRVNSDGTVNLYQVDRDGNQRSTYLAFGNQLTPVPVVLGKDGKRVEAGDTVILDGDESKVWTVDRITPQGKSMKLRRYDPKKQTWEELTGVKPTRVASGEGIVEPTPEGTTTDVDGKLIQRDDYVNFTSGTGTLELFMVSQVLDDGRVLLMCEDIDGNQYSAGIAGTHAIRKVRVPVRVPEKDLDGYPVKAGAEKYRATSLDPDDPDAEWVITDTLFSAGGRMKVAKVDAQGTVIPGTERYNVHPKRLSRVNKPGQTATAKNGEKIVIGKRYTVPSDDGRHDGVWEAMSFKPDQYDLEAEPIVLSMRVKDDGTLDFNEVRRFRPHAMLPEGIDGDDYDIVDAPTFIGKVKGSRSQGILSLSPEHAKQAQDDYKDIRRRGWLKPDSEQNLKKNKSIQFANAPANVTVTVSEVGGRWRVRIDAYDTQLIKADAANSAVFADNPSDALLLAATAVRSWERRAYEQDPSGKKDAFGRRAANRRPRDFDGFHAYDDGIRGLDWKMESDPDVDWTDKVARRRMVDKELAELGTTVKHLNPATQSFDDFDVEHLENIARTLRTHENQYPGIVRKMFPELRYDPKRGNNIAYTNIERSWGRRQGEEQWEYMGFSGDWFGNRHDPSNNAPTREAAWEGYRPKQPAERPVGFGVNAPEDLVAAQLFDSYTAAGVVDVTTHEMGHNVGFALYGMMGRNRRHEAPELMDSPDPQARLTNKYREEFFRILDAYGILDSNVPITFEDYIAKNKLQDNPNTRTMFARFQSEMLDDSGVGTNNKEYKAGVMNREALAEHLSRYGSTNLQELMAETWTGYQHNQNPGDFVREMGQLMEDVLIDFLDDTQAGPEAEFLGRTRSEARKRAIAYRDEPWPDNIAAPEAVKVDEFFDKMYPKKNIERIIAMLTSPEDSEWENEGGEPLFGAGFFRREDGSINQEAKIRYTEGFMGLVNSMKNRNVMPDEEVEDLMEKRGFTAVERKAFMLAREHARSVMAYILTREPAGGRHRKED